MRELPEGSILGPARLLILGLFALISGCFLARVFSASPASAAESPHSDTGTLDGPASRLTQIEVQLEQQVDRQITRASDAAVAVAAPIAGSRLATVVAHVPKTTATVTGIVTQATRASGVVTGVVAQAGSRVVDIVTAPLLTLPGLAELAPPVLGLNSTITDSAAIWPLPAASTAERFACTATVQAASTTSAPDTDGLDREGVARAPQSPVNPGPLAPQHVFVTSGGMQSGNDGLGSGATIGGSPWMPTLAVGINGTANDLLPSSVSEGFDTSPA